MRIPNNFQKLLIGGFATLTLVAAVACSGGTDAIDPTVVIGDADGNSLKDKRREP